MRFSGCQASIPVMRGYTVSATPATMRAWAARASGKWDREVPRRERAPTKQRTDPGEIAPLRMGRRGPDEQRADARTHEGPNQGTLKRAFPPHPPIRDRSLAFR